MAQDAPPANPATAGSDTSVDQPDTATVAERPGRFKLGPFYLTPRLNVGTIGLDSNVNYTPTDRQLDMTANGGPELDVVLPVGMVSRFDVVGGLDYLFFLRTVSQRKLNGHASASLSRTSEKSHAKLAESYSRTNSRLGFEVDKRVQRTEEATQLELGQKELIGPFGLGFTAKRGRTEADQGEVYLGTDLSRTLSQNTYLVGGDLTYALTPLTSLVIHGSRTFNRFLFDKDRDANTDLLAGGVRTEPEALIGGQVLIGVQRFQTLATPTRPAVRRQTTYFSVGLTVRLSPRTSLDAGYVQGIDYSAFQSSGRTPTVLRRGLSGTLTRQLSSKIDVRLFAGRTWSVTDGAIDLVLPNGQHVSKVRDDVAWRGGVNIGYRLSARLRAGIEGAYTERNSTVDYFGIQGLLAGFTVDYDP